MLSSHWQSPTSSIVSPINCTCANLIHVVCQPSPGKRKAKQASSIQINHCIVYLLQGNDTIIARKSRHSSETLTITLHPVAGPVTEPDLKSGQSNSVGGVVGGALQPRRPPQVQQAPRSRCPRVGHWLWELLEGSREPPSSSSSLRGRVAEVCNKQQGFGFRII